MRSLNRKTRRIKKPNPRGFIVLCYIFIARICCMRLLTVINADCIRNHNFPVPSFLNVIRGCAVSITRIPVGCQRLVSGLSVFDTLASCASAESRRVGPRCVPTYGQYFLFAYYPPAASATCSPTHVLASLYLATPY